MKHLILRSLIAAFALLHAGMLVAEPLTRIPNFIGESDLAGRDEATSVRALRFVTTLNFPPFNYLDADGRLTGFNVYLAKAICAELKIQASCTIQAQPFEELEETIRTGRGDAAIAGFAANAQSREQFGFSNSYLRFPGRFVTLKGNTKTFDFDGGLSGVKIGVIADTGQEKLARSYFPKATIVGIASEALLIAELNNEKVEMIFGDGLYFGFWVNGEASKACCTLVGGAYYSPVFLGEGMRIAALNSRPDVIQSVNKALNSIQQKKGIEELFLRFFPHSFY
jgi:polar amino acid transport system substrate-binding protein